MIEKRVTGNYEMNLMLTGEPTPEETKVFFSGDTALGKRAYLAISADELKVIRETNTDTQTWKTYNNIGTPPWNVKVLKKGNFFRFWVNNITGWIRGPLGEWENVYEPMDNSLGVETPAGISLQSWTVTTLPWLQEITEPIISRGPKDSFYEKQIIPGAIIEYEGLYYMYVMAGMAGEEEGSSRRSIGVAVSSDLKQWEVHPEPLISYRDTPYDNLYVSGAVVTDDGRVAIMFSAQKFPEWQGFMLATAEHPVGPFTQYANNPVYKHFTHAHEFDLIRTEGLPHHYLLFYAGFTPKPQHGLAGDRGYLLYSDDLVNWHPDERNPVFAPGTLDNWDAIHVRPRSLNKIGDTWYLWYEGCNTWKPEGVSHHGWWDTVGLARSKDLINWEYYPRNPALPGLGVSPDQFDSNWVGWPRMYIKDGVGYVFYTGNAQVGLRTIPLEDLTNWHTEGGQTLDLF
ncbi:MAG: hypothetical protein OYL97_08890 [Candidatus Poribacteria bacterium]|nr:hypothetical protein [Candidatus Poribacteria bacterium]